MRNVLSKVRTRTGAVVVGIAVALTGAGAATAAVIDSPATEAPATTSEPASLTPEETDAGTRAATVDDVTTETAETSAQTTDAPAPEPAPEPQPADDGVGTTGADGNYTPAPPRPEPGAPPVGTIAPMPQAPPLPGEG